jgi:hypothetical protein
LPTYQLWDLEEQLQNREYRAQLASEGRSAAVVETIVGGAIMWIENNSQAATLDEINENFESWALPTVTNPSP